MAYIGNEPGVASQRVVSTFTATAGQTTFTPISGYTLGYIDVYLNGIKLVDGDDYTAANGMTVVLASGAAVGDSVECVAFFPRGLSDGYLKSEADARYVGLTGDQTIAGVKTFSGSATIINGNLGVGTSSVLGNSTFNAALGIAVRNQSTSMGYFQTYNANAGSNLKTWRFGGDASGNLLFETVNDAYSSSTGRLMLDAAGSLLINNVSNEGFRFKVTDGGGNLARFTNGATQTMDVVLDSSGFTLQNPNNGYIAFKGASTERGRFDSSGNFIVSSAASRISKLGAVTSINLGTGDTIGDTNTNIYIGGDSAATAFHIRMYNGGYYYPFKLSNTGLAMIGGITSPIAIPAGSVRLSVGGNTAQYGTDGYSVGGRTFLRFGVAVNTTYTVTIALGDSVYALADIRAAVYCGAGSGKANAHFAYGGHVGAYHMNTVYNSFSGNVTVGSPTISGNNIVFTVSIANAGQNGMAMIQVIDVNATTGYVSSISVA